ncbi:MAG: XrtA-associated tyrosine autokinase [Colwellia sp.]
MSTIEKALAKQKRSNEANKNDAVVDNNITIDDNEPATTQTATKQTSEKQVKTKPPKEKTSPDIIQIDGDSLMSRGFIFDSNSKHQTQEEFRGIKRKLLNNAFGPASKTLNNSNLIMVSSANPNEGKTFISINLALSIALEQDKTVLLIDADVLRPSVHRELEFEIKQGLLEYLLSEVPDISDIIYNTSIPNLRIIPAGRPHHLTNELLTSDRMEKLAKELASRYPDRLVIFDCPPILGINETPVLSSLVGQAVVVVEESKTKIDDVKHAVSELNEDIAVGFVMNKTIRSKKDVYGYYGYGYGKK